MKLTAPLLTACAAITFALPSQDNTVVDTVERDGILYNVFEDIDLGARMEFVTNSGVCETTKGVTQHSGYLSVGTEMHMWFWFFEARNDPKNAPFASWFNGGPGCSSMIGLFQENGPCHFVNGEKKPSLNPYSFNEFANMLYVDQPIGTGFSYGIENVDSTVTAAPAVWKLLQLFFKKFPQYKSRDYGLFTESYGGHYGPEFTYYIEQQNKKISNGDIKGQHIDLVALGVNNGIYDSAIQEKAYIEFSHNNSYNQIITASQAKQLYKAYDQHCAPALAKCTTTDSKKQDSACYHAQSVCQREIDEPIENAKNFDVYDVRRKRNDPYPPETYVNYLKDENVKKKIGARSNYTECAEAVDLNFVTTGDDARSFLPQLSDVVKSGIQVLLWAGDADWICNYVGGFGVVNAIQWSKKKEFNGLKLKDYTVKGTKGSKGLFKTVDNLSWLQVYGAGHEVPYYKPKVALQAFKQTLSKERLHST